MARKEKLEKRIPIYMTLDEYEKFKQKAEDYGISMNELARQAIKKFSTKEDIILNEKPDYVARKCICEKCGMEFFTRKDGAACKCGGKAIVDETAVYLIYKAEVQKSYRIVKTGQEIKCIDEDGNERSLDEI